MFKCISDMNARRPDRTGESRVSSRRFVSPRQYAQVLSLAIGRAAKRIGKGGILLALAGLLLTPPVVGAHELNQMPPDSKRLTTFNARVISLGLYPGGCSIEEYERRLDVKFNHVLMFQNINRLDYSKVRQQLDKGYAVVLTITFRETYANLKDVRDGAYDSKLADLIGDIKDDGREISVRPLHEFNGDWDSWDVFYPGNNPEDFIPAWKHVVKIFRERQAPVKMQLNYNRLNGFDKRKRVNDTTPFVELYPGDDWVDMVVITSYNRAYTDPFHQYWRDFNDEFDGAYNQVLAMTDKPIGIAEMGTTSYGGDKPKWILDAFIYIKHKYTKVVQVTWFLYNRPENNVVWDWDLNTEKDVEAFRDGISILERKDEPPAVSRIGR